MINELVGTNQIKVEDRDLITTAIKKRESGMSTGIGFGIELPHASTDSVSELVGILGYSKLGIQFESPDGKPVHGVALFLVSQDQFHKYQHTLAELAKMLHQNPGEFPFP